MILEAISLTVGHTEVGNSWWDNIVIFSYKQHLIGQDSFLAGQMGMLPGFLKMLFRVWQSGGANMSE